MGNKETKTEEILEIKDIEEKKIEGGKSPHHAGLQKEH